MRQNDFSPSDYRRRAEAAQDWLQRRLWDPKAGRYRPSDPAKADALPYDFMWGNGVAFSALVGGARIDRRAHAPLLERFLAGLEAYWDKDAPIPGYDAYFASPNGDDKYYDDNAWMVLTYAEAHEVTGDRRYLSKADAVMKYVLSGWDERLGGGIYWRQDKKSKNTCSNGPAAAAALALAARGVDALSNVEWARRVVDWTTKNLQAPDGLFWDNVALDGRVEKTQWTYNTALMLRSCLGLYRVTREKRYLEAAKRMARASEKGFVNPRTGAFRDDALFSHLLVEAFLDLHRETREPYLLDRARANADFAWSRLRDGADGGFWTKWQVVPDRKEERKTLIANAAVARMFWLLADAPGANRVEPGKAG